jgi:hypothetical protein
VLDLSSGTFTHLVAPGDSAPGMGGGSFTTFDGYALVSGGEVIFLSTDPMTNGLYSIPVTGGAVSVIANLNTRLPGFGTGAGFQYGNSAQFVPQSDGQHVAFWARDNKNGEMWLYIANMDGTELTELAGPNTQVMPPGSCQVPVVQYVQPRVNGSKVTLMGGTNNGIGPFLYVTGLAGFPTAPTCTPGGFVAYAPILQYNTPLPGEPAAVQFFYASYVTLDNSNVYFTAQGNTPFGSFGVFQENLDGTGLTAILNSNEAGPGINPPYAISGGTTGFTAENGTLVFSVGGTGSDGSQAGALLAYQGGSLVRIAGTGDALADITGNSFAPPVGPNSINNGRVVFSFGNPNTVGSSWPHRQCEKPVRPRINTNEHE